MREYKCVLAFAVAAGFAAFGALDLSAQTVDPTGPTCVAEDYSSSTYTATVTTNYSYDFRLKVYKNGILKHDSTTHVTTSGPTSYFSKVVSYYTWGLAADDMLEFVGRATLTEGPNQGSYDEKTLTRDVMPPGGCRNVRPVLIPFDPPSAIREELA